MKNAHQGNRENMGGNQAKMHTGKMGQPGAQHNQQHAMNQMQRNQQMRNAQMGGGGKHPQMGGGGNRPQPKGQPQQQGKKKPNQH